MQTNEVGRVPGAARWAAGVMALALLLTGCASSGKLAEENNRLRAENQSLQQEISRLAADNERLAAERKGTPVNLVDPNYADPPGGTDSWGYRKTLTADLDGDGAEERVVVITNAYLDPTSGRVGWDDGHPWHVYVEEPDGRRTLLFARWVQLGKLHVMLGEEPAGLIIQQDSGVGSSLYLVDYRGPDQADAVELLSLLVRDRAGFPPGVGYAE